MKTERNTCLTWAAAALGAIAMAGCSGATTATNSPDDTAEYETMPAEENEGIGDSQEPFAPGSADDPYGTESQQPGQNPQNPGTNPGMQENPQSPGTQPGSPGSPRTQPGTQGSPGTQPGSPGTQGSPGTEGAPDTQGLTPGTSPRDPSDIDRTRQPGAGTQPAPQGSTGPHQGTDTDQESRSTL